MSAQAFEVVLARLYSDGTAWQLFCAAPEQLLNRYELTGQERDALLSIERTGLEMAVKSYNRKREKNCRKGVHRGASG